MILIDYRTGSKELLPLFPPHKAKLATLQYGDFSFIGNGPEGMPYAIGVERKQVREIAGTMMDGRLVGHQIPGLLAMYQVVYLVVEGRWRGNPRTGVLEHYRGREWKEVEIGIRRFMVYDLIKFLTTLETMAGVKVRKTEDQVGTVDEVVGLEGWWAGKKWEDHGSHRAIPSPTLEVTPFSKVSLLQDLAYRLPNVGWKRSVAVEAYFRSIREMFEADEGEWAGIEGIGKGTAKKIVEAIKWRRG